MQQKTITVIVILLLMSFGFLIGTFTTMYIGRQTVPASHQTIIDTMIITDTRLNLVLTPKLVDSGSREWGAGYPLSTTFTLHENYPQSTWIWQRYGDTEIAMSIWGPDKSGTTYYIEVSRLSGDPFTVKINGVTKLTIDAITNTGPAIGYYQLEVTVD